MSAQRKVILMVMDGWGSAPDSVANAISAANTPFVDSLYRNYPHSLLSTSGHDVGLPEGQMGNSEVGHLNIGAGRVVYQELELINKSIRNHEIDQNPVLLETFRYCKNNGKALHFMGLLSDGGVHSHIAHLEHLCRIASEYGLKQIFIHAFMDGRDTDPNGGLVYMNHLENNLAGTGARVASIIGRYYAMDRDKRWERVRLAYDLLVNNAGTEFSSATDAIRTSYENGITDEFIKPCVITSAGKPVAAISDGDAVMCFNFRTDRCREITNVLTQSEMPEFGMRPLSLHYVTMTRYDKNFKDVHVVFEKDNLNNTLGQVVSDAGCTQLRIAETEKYPHVTFFFSGGREEVFDGEDRIMIPSPKVATYDMKPSMSAFELTDALVPAVLSSKYDFICVNYANADMVGHTGDFNAAVQAVETVDHCVSRIVKAGLEAGYTLLITADHGNADYMINSDGSPNTAHTTNPVPCFLVSPDKSLKKLDNGKLADLAPTVLQLMGLSVPTEMTGRVLLTS